MALRSSAQLKYYFSRLRTGSGNSGFATSTIPKMKPHAPTADIDHTHEPDMKLWPLKAEFVPVYVALGLIAMSTSFGTYTALHQLKRAPNVYVKKSRRETVPEVAEPERVAEDVDQFINKSFFRKVAHVQDSDRQDTVPNPIAGDVYAWKPHFKAATLKDVGAEPPKDKPPKDA
ncbi:uncharacterized protein LOC113769489 [Coffea eugenioides]|uniref:uncharacterized protein LOC113769489 n=1 Tax=Coffea eugenioides TaxID=49369 RepID=UPI000F60C168|nr:uncharacterized protein LOC113769489 [Coffea eugenioides]